MNIQFGSMYRFVPGTQQWGGVDILSSGPRKFVTAISEPNSTLAKQFAERTSDPDFDMSSPKVEWLSIDEMRIGDDTDILLTGPDVVFNKALRRLAFLVEGASSKSPYSHREGLEAFYNQTIDGNNLGETIQEFNQRLLPGDLAVFVPTPDELAVLQEHFKDQEIRLGDITPYTYDRHIWERLKEREKGTISLEYDVTALFETVVGFEYTPREGSAEAKTLTFA